MKQIKGWGIPTVGALSLSLGLWAVIFFGWIQLTEIVVGIAGHCRGLAGFGTHTRLGHSPVISGR